MLRRWSIALSLAWGVTLGGFAAFYTAALLLGIGWLYVYGDDVWPERFTDAVLLAAALVGFITFAAVALLVFNLRRISPWLDGRLQASAALRWALLALPLLLLSGALWTQQRQEAAADRARAVEAAAAQRQGQAHRLVSAEWRLDASSGRLRLELAAEGMRAGSYALLWEARGTGADRPLGSGSAAQSLSAGPARLTLELDAADLARSYAEAVLSRPEPVQIDLSLSVELSLSLEGGGAADAHGSRLRLEVPLSYDWRPDGRVVFAAPAG
jgi:hypothetical protein